MVRHGVADLLRRRHERREKALRPAALERELADYLRPTATLLAEERVGRNVHVLEQHLVKQKDPVVQISLIRLMVEMKEKSVIKELDRITKDNESIKAVKDEAYSGLLKLS